MQIYPEFFTNLLKDTGPRLRGGDDQGCDALLCRTPWLTGLSVLWFFIQKIGLKGKSDGGIHKCQRGQSGKHLF